MPSLSVVFKLEISSTLTTLPQDIAAANLTGPALTFVGLSPRRAVATLTKFQQQELA